MVIVEIPILSKLKIYNSKGNVKKFIIVKMLKINITNIFLNLLNGKKYIT